MSNNLLAFIAIVEHNFDVFVPRASHHTHFTMLGNGTH